MICPRCNSHLINDACYCTRCGLDLKAYHQQNQNVMPQKKRMIGNAIFAVLMFYNAFVYGSNILMGFFSMYSLESLLYSLIYIAVSVFFAGMALLIGITLWKRKKVGLILALINNALSCIGGLFLSGFGTWFTWLGFTGTGEYDGLGILFGIPLLIAGLVYLTIGVVFLVYYIVQRKNFT